jgi:hypothetical protein
MTRSEFETFLITALENIAGVLTNGAIAFVCMDHAHIGELLIAGDAVFDERLNICVWDKGRGGMGSLWRSQHELVAVFKTGDGPHINAVELGRHGRNRTNLWSFPGMTGFGRGKKKALELHPTVKPVALVAEALLDVTDQGQVVLDPFARLCGNSLADSAGLLTGVCGVHGIYRGSCARAGAAAAGIGRGLCGGGQSGSVHRRVRR